MASVRPGRRQRQTHCRITAGGKIKGKHRRAEECESNRGGRKGKGQQEQNTSRAKNLRRAPPEGSAQFYFMGQMEAGDGGRRAQQEGAAGGREEDNRKHRRKHAEKEIVDR